MYATINSTAIFIWWPTAANHNIRQFRIQFRLNDSTNPTKFSDQIIGTTEPIHEYADWSDIDPKLLKISAITNTFVQNITLTGGGDRQYRRAKRILPKMASFQQSGHIPTADTRNRVIEKRVVQSNITEVRVPGNVTGILIPNTSQIIVRIIVPLIDENNEEFIQDYRYVEWKTVKNIFQNFSYAFKINKIICFLLQIPSYKLNYILDIKSRSITIIVQNPNITCLKICYRYDDTNCPTFKQNNSKFSVKALLPNTLYKMKIFDCYTNSLAESLTTRTKHDAPGPITNWNYTIQNGNILIRWDAPEKVTSELKYYTIEWTLHNETHIDHTAIDKRSFLVCTFK